MNMYANARDYDGLERYHIRDCMECGSCAYICPARIPLVENFRIAKAHLPKAPPPPPTKEKKEKKGGSLFGRKK
jgi:electron transport complex protein RnfC